MSSADVRFHRMDGMPAFDTGEEATFSFNCPFHVKRRCEGHVVNGWDGNNPAAPTFSPSINCGGCGWHGYIRTGRCKDVHGMDEPEPG